jgi:hypothetical protein
MTSTELAPAIRTSTRDPLLDLVRSGAIALVVLQHWLMPVIGWDGATLTAGNALTAPGAWAWTWLGQVMPLVFFAAGAAGAISWSRGGPGWFGARLHRLVTPVLPVLVVWVPMPALLVAIGVGSQPVGVAAAIVPQLLWFLVVQLVLVAMTPLAVAAHRRHGLGVLVPLAAGAAAVDTLRFAGVPVIGYLNAVLVWVAVHQLGVAYAHGRFDSVTPAGALRLAAGGLTATGLLVALGPYPASMIGMPGAPVSNMSPPTLCLITLACAHLGLVLAARPALLRLAVRPRVAAAVALLAPRTMTVFLWHMTALAAGVGVLTLGLGLGTPAPASIGWLLGAPLWVAVLGAALALLVRAFGGWEARTPGRGAPAATPVLVAGYVLAAGGMLGLAARGFAPAAGPGLVDLVEPACWAAAIVAGHLLGTGVRSPRGAPRASGPPARA